MKSFLIACVACLITSNVSANTGDDTGFIHDRALAQQQMDPLAAQHCLKDFSKKIKTQGALTADGPFSFNEYISRDIYHTLYWKAGERGVAFTVPVKVKDPLRGDVSTNLACFYAMRDDALVFQYSQQISWRL